MVSDGVRLSDEAAMTVLLLVVSFACFKERKKLLAE